jgi:hypothetical protein
LSNASTTNVKGVETPRLNPAAVVRAPSGTVRIAFDESRSAMV